MSKKRRNLIILLAATVLLGGLLWLVTGLDDGNGEDDAAHTSQTSDSDHSRQSGTLIDAEQDDLQSIVFTNQNAKYTAYIDEDKGEVAFKELKGFSVNSAFMEYVWYGVAQMTYNDIITTTDADGYNAEVYGFDKPSLTVTAVFSGGRKYEFIAGGNVPGAEDDVYYTLLKGDNHVYACTIDVPFFMGDSYYLNDDVFYSYDSGIESSDITIGDITLSGKAFDGEFVMKVNKESDLSSPMYGYDYVVTSPINWPVKKSSSSMLVYDLTYMMADDVVKLNPTKAQLKSYGLNEPSLTVDFVRNGKKCVMYCSQPDKNTMYVMLKGGKIVYMLQSDSLSILHDLSPENLYSLNAVSISVETISGIKISSPDMSVRLDVSRKKNENAMQESDVIYIYSSKANGKDIKYSLYTNFVKQLNNSVIQHWNVKAPGGKADVTISVEYFDSYNRAADTIKFYKYSDREYAVVWGGSPVNTVSSTWLNQLLQNAGQL